MLAKKAGEVSNAGRDTFLAADADRTLAVLVECCSEGRVAAALLGCVAHKSPQTRAKVAAHLDSTAQGEHGQRLAGEGLLSWAISVMSAAAAAAATAHRKACLRALQLRLAALPGCVAHKCLQTRTKVAAHLDLVTHEGQGQLLAWVRLRSGLDRHWLAIAAEAGCSEACWCRAVLLSLAALPGCRAHSSSWYVYR